MTETNYMLALEAAWNELKQWADDGRFKPENEEDIQCFLYRGLVNELKTATGVRPKPTTDKPRSIFDRNGKLDVKDMHFPDFILGNPKNVVVEIKFARGTASIFGSCKKDVEKMKLRHNAQGISKVFILFDVHPEHVFLGESQLAVLKAIDPTCHLFHYPESLNPGTANTAAQKAADTKKKKAAAVQAKRSAAAKKAHATRKVNAATTQLGKAK